VLVNGQQRDPRVALRSSGGEPIPQAERDEFARVKDQLLASLETPTTGVTKLAQR
jgi:hypothetical protein